MKDEFHLTDADFAQPRTQPDQRAVKGDLIVRCAHAPEHGGTIYAVMAGDIVLGMKNDPSQSRMANWIKICDDCAAICGHNWARAGQYGLIAGVGLVTMRPS